MQSPSSSYQESEEEVDQEDYYSDDDRVSLRSNKRTKTKSNNDGRDRISALPDPLLHHILSFMDMKEVMGTNSLSRRWRYLWKYIPILSFSHILWYVKHKMRSGDSEKRMFMDFVKQVLLLRDISSTIKILSFHCSRYCKTDQVDDWMRVAVTRHVEEVILNYDPGMYTVLPGFIFNSAISVFKLSSFPHALQVPNSICLAPKLKTLELESVRLPEGNSICEVVFSCPMLENLSIIYCDHSHIYMLNISALQLKNLKIQNTVECGNSSCFISISAPNLTSLRLKGSLYANYYLENLSSLVDAKIECLLYERVYPQLLIKILRGLQNATSLELSGQSLSTDLRTSHDTSYQKFDPFLNLRSLKLLGWSDSSPIQNLLKSSPHIETLALGVNQVMKAKDWGEVFQNIHYLKSIEIQDIEGCTTELKFIEFVLKTAVLLEELTVTTHKVCSLHKEKELEKFRKKMHSIPPASAGVRILFQLKTSCYDA